MKERPILFSAPLASDKKPEALELADHPGTSFAAQEMLRRQHARIEELELMLEGVIGSLDDYAVGEPFGTYDRQILDGARALLTKKD